MKLAYLSSHSSVPSRAANSVHIMRMCDAYAEIGIDVTLFVSNSGERNSLEEIKNFYHIKNCFKIHYHRQPKGWFFSKWLLFFGVPLKVWFKNFDVVHTRNLATAFGLVKFFKVPVILELHDSPFKNEHSKKMYYGIQKYDHLKIIVSITAALAEHIKPHTYNPKKILVLPDGVSNNFLHENKNFSVLDHFSQLRERYKLIAGYTGHLYEGRGINLIVNLARELPEIYFYLAGGTDQEIFKYRLETSHLPNIEFAGFKSQKEIQVIQKSVDVLLMPYENKVSVSTGGDTAKFASPLKMFEYMASGKPIISSRLPVLFEVLKDGYNAFMVPYEEIDSWKKILLELSEDKSKGAKIAAQAKVDVRNFTWEKRAKYIVDFFKKNSN